MGEKTVWPPPPANQRANNVSRPYGFMRSVSLAVGVGLALGLFDLCNIGSLAVSAWIMAGAAAILGFLRPKKVWLSVFILSLCFYLVHVAAIEVGLKRPYVEPDVDSALFCWLSLVPNGIGGLVGVLAKAITKAQQANSARL